MRSKVSSEYLCKHGGNVASSFASFWLSLQFLSSFPLAKHCMGLVSGPQTLSPFLFSYLTFVGGKGNRLAFSCTLRNVRVVLFVIITPT